MTDVPGMGPKSFEQCAGFLKIPDSTEALDNTWVHPENYEAARVIKENITTTGNLSSSAVSELKEKYKIGDTTITDIVEELKKPGRDPREGFPKPIMQKGVITFEDLKEGQMVTGKIKNVVDFGAFVDLGIKETALVHISELSDTFVKDPLALVKAGDMLEFRIVSLDPDRRRISLSRRSGSTVRGTVRGEAKPGNNGEAKARGDGGQSRNDSGKAKVTVKKDNSRTGGGKPDFSRNAKDDDGTMYNPFALAFKKK